LSLATQPGKVFRMPVRRNSVSLISMRSIVRVGRQINPPAENSGYQ
jgi:hypothetical protein